jgi:hypothetical protein
LQINITLFWIEGNFLFFVKTLQIIYRYRNTKVNFIGIFTSILFKVINRSDLIKSLRHDNNFLKNEKSQTHFRWEKWDLSVEVKPWDCRGIENDIFWCSEIQTSGFRWVGRLFCRPQELTSQITAKKLSGTSFESSAEQEEEMMSLMSWKRGNIWRKSS